MVNKGFDYRHYVHTPAELAREYVQWAEMLKETPGIPFGVPAIDEHVLPAHPGDVVSFIGRPGHGKSSLLAWFALQQAGRITARGALGSEAVVYVTYEQAAEELEMFFQMGGTYKNSDLARGKVDLELVRERSLARASLPIWTIGHGLGRVDPRAPRMTPEVVYAAIETMQQDHGVKPVLILVDYMQLIPIAGAADRMQAVTEVPIRVKELAMRVGCPAMLAVQASRDVDKRDEQIPTMADAQWACLAGDTVIRNADTGDAVSAAALWQIFDSGGIDSFPVHSFVERGMQMAHGEIVAAKRNPAQMVYRMVLGNAGSVRANLGHKFYTPSGWSELRALKVGNWIARPKRLPSRLQDSELSPDSAFVLGLLLGDGTVTKALTLTNSDQEVLDSFQSAVERQWPGYTTEERKQTAWTTYDSTIRRLDRRVFPNGNEVLVWFKEIGVFGQKAETKHVPALQMDDSAVSALLSGLFTTDGGVSFRNNRPMVTFATCSKALADDVVYFLLRLGISSTLREQRHKGKRMLLYVVRPAATDLHEFVRLVPIVGPKGRKLAEFVKANPDANGRSMGDLLPPEWNMQAIDSLKARHLRTRHNNVKGRGITRGRLARIAADTGDLGLAEMAGADLAWHEITAIVEDGFEPTYDFHVPGAENFMANGILAHNSSIEQTCDKVFGLWRPWQTQGPNKPVEINGQTYQNAANLLVLRMLKQRFENGRWTWALYFDPALLRLAELEIRDDQAGRGWEPD